MSIFCFFQDELFTRTARLSRNKTEAVIVEKQYVSERSKYTFDLVWKGVHENRTKGVENKVDDTLIDWN